MNKSIVSFKKERQNQFCNAKAIAYVYKRGTKYTSRGTVKLENKPTTLWLKMKKINRQLT